MKNDKQELQTAPKDLGDEATAPQEQASTTPAGDFGDEPVYEVGSVVSIDESGIATLTGDVRVCVPALCVGDTVVRQGFKFFRKEED